MAHRHLTYSVCAHSRVLCPFKCIAPCVQSRHSSKTWEAVGALARHIILKAPDKADQRVIATDAAASIMVQLPVMHQHQFVLFIARLARTPKVRECYITLNIQHVRAVTCRLSLMMYARHQLSVCHVVCNWRHWFALPPASCSKHR